jgi:membrane-associated protease RseP (regulator of RpoE activity)
MRLWPSRRPSPVTSGPTDDLLIMEDILRRNIEDLLLVRERQIRGGAIVFRGDLLIEPARAVELMLARFRPFGYTPFLQREHGEVSVRAVPLAEVTDRSRVGVNVVLFLLTCLTTLAAGSHAFVTFNPLTDPGRLIDGVPFASALLLILGTHEFGHYFTARHYRASVSLPYFIPAPPPFIMFGTLGAIIRMRSPARDRNSLFDIAAAGPLAGLVIAVPIILLGLEWSRVGQVPPGHGIVFGDSLLMRALVYVQFGSIPDGTDVFIHPVGLAGWVGLFVTALNLFPVGQLDGGRIVYALVGARHRLVGIITFGALIVMGIVTRSLNWVVWAMLLFLLIGFQHTPPLDDLTPLSSGRRLVGVACLILLLLLIPPVPIQIN